jgi:type II restriction enzyme
MKESLYFGFLGVKTQSEVVSRFLGTLIDTNRDHRFFVDWGKVRENANRLKVELNILNALVGSRDFERELTSILEKYPEVLAAVPILLALRDPQLRVILDFQSPGLEIVNYDFSPRKLSELDIRNIGNFFVRTGLRNFFLHLASRCLLDYVVGVEVGMDTNARKNRSGAAMELALAPVVEPLRSSRVAVLYQKKFKVLVEEYGIDVPRDMQPRKTDILFVVDRKRAVNIETNFYSGTGSKPQEIVDSYINRQRELAEAGIGFIWVTDGDGWRGQRNQIEKGFAKVDYLMNLRFARAGMLKEALAVESTGEEDGRRAQEEG